MMNPNQQSSPQPFHTKEKGKSADDLTPGESRSFVLKIWIEPIEPESGQVSWRGHITQVVNRTGQYVKSLDEINAYLIRQLQEMGGGNIQI